MGGGQVFAHVIHPVYGKGIGRKLTAYAGDGEGDLLSCAALLRNAQVGVAVGGIVYVLLETVCIGIKGDGIGYGIGIGSGIAFGKGPGIRGVQGPYKAAHRIGCAYAGDADYAAENDVIAHGVNYGGACAVHTFGGGLGNVCKGCGNGILIGAYEYIPGIADDAVQIILLYAVAYCVYGAEFTQFSCLIGCGLSTFGGCVCAGGSSAGELNGRGAVALLADAVCHTVAEQNGELNRSVGNVAHVEAVVSQGQTCVSVGGVVHGSQGVDSILDGGHTRVGLDINPFANGLGILAVRNYGNEDFAGVCFFQAVKEIAVAGEDLLHSFQTIGVVASLSAIAAAAFAAVLHGAGGVDYQRDGSLAGNYGLGGFYGKGDLKLVDACLLYGLAEGEALLIYHGLGAANCVSGGIDGEVTVHYLVGITFNCQSAHGDQADHQNQRQQYGQKLSAHSLVSFLCHNFFSSHFEEIEISAAAPT